MGKGYNGTVGTRHETFKTLTGMLPFNIDARRLTDKAVITIHPIEIDHLETTLEAGMYEPCADFHRMEPRSRNPKNIFKLVPVRQLLKEMLKWKCSGKLWVIQPNEPGMEVRISVEVAIILFEICEASNSPSLKCLKGNVKLHLKDKFNIDLKDRKTDPELYDPDEDVDYYYFELL